MISCLEKAPGSRPWPWRSAAVRLRAVVRDRERWLVAAVVVLTSTLALAEADVATVRPVGGALLAGTASEPGHLNPAITTAGNVHAVTASLFNGLVGLDQNAEPVPELAERWQVSRDGKTITFFLRSDVRWHDGTPFTSADVKFTFEELLLKFHARTRAGLQDTLAEITAPEPYTVVFRFHHSYAPFLRRLDVIEAPILPRHIYQGKDPFSGAVNNRPVGTGPFRFGSWARGNNIVLTRNEAYFRKGRPFLERVTFRFLPTTAAAVVALEAGEVDYLAGVEGADLNHLRGAKKLILARSAAGSGGSFCINTLIPNLRKPPLQKTEVRQAINLAIDRKFILERVNFGAGHAARGPIHSELAWFDPALPAFPLDRQQANRLLDGAGYPISSNGSRFSLRFAYAHAGFGPLADALKTQLAQVGIELMLEPGDFNAVAERVFVKSDFDLGVASYCNGADPDIGVKRVYHSKNIVPIPFSNGAAYRSVEVDALFDRAVQTFDRAERIVLYREIQNILVRDVPYFWLIETEGQRAFRSQINGLRTWSGNAFEDAYIDAAPRP